MHTKVKKLFEFTTSSKADYFNGFINIKEGKTKHPMKWKIPLEKALKVQIPNPTKSCKKNDNKTTVPYELDANPNYPNYIPPVIQKKAKPKKNPNMKFVLIY